MIRYYVNMTEEMPFTFDHLIKMYNPRLFRGGLIKLHCRAPRAFFACIEEVGNGGWMSHFVRVRTSDLIPVERMLFLKRWNMEPVAIYPGAVTDLSGWVGRLDSICPYAKRVWCDLYRARWEAKDHGLGEIPLMKGTSLSEEGTLGPDEGRKRQREPSNEPPESKKMKVEETKVDPETLTLRTAGSPRV
ncbi:uncharacterized protein [Nicotiana sylvestris]|uniref:Uncharacterized protein LOC104236264 n=1 Tax=Nicotiana sylvestris TaxID=4096 RepID=A0A1U7XND8_NICSY|nr:PREDICTED: uncharacterized protein LOC104236264 [Nicotiana sylvestris]XP_009788463.1 PREDICTED: uncharacterized protein LOC104236264 [Nicotiana sylvestris]